MNNKTPYWYIATAYTNFTGGPIEAFQVSAKATAYFLKRGIHAYGPIAHSHPVAVHGELDKYDHEFWMWVDQPFMEGAQGLIVVATDEDIEKSSGIQHEIEMFKLAEKPVLQMDPWDIPELREHYLPT